MSPKNSPIRYLKWWFTAFSLVLLSFARTFHDICLSIYRIVCISISITKAENNFTVVSKLEYVYLSIKQTMEKIFLQFSKDFTIPLWEVPAIHPFSLQTIYTFKRAKVVSDENLAWIFQFRHLQFASIFFFPIGSFFRSISISPTFFF